VMGDDLRCGVVFRPDCASRNAESAGERPGQEGIIRPTLIKGRECLVPDIRPD
jgi:hypothetical protein